MLPKLTLIRDLDSENLLEIFLISAISAILVIRLYLELTGYPKIGTGGLHIAHMLWGGMLMVIAILMMLIFLNRDKYWLASLLAGLGFGTFIDELGKFITKDNNYFFEPTISIIYVIFVLLYIATRAIEKLTPPTQKELLINVVEVEQQALTDPVEIDRLNKAYLYLSQIDPSQPFLSTIKSLLDQLKSASKRTDDDFLYQIKKSLSNAYETLAKRQFLNWLIIAIFLIQAGYFLFNSIITTDILSDYFSPTKDSVRSFDELGYVVFTAISGLLILVGVARLFKSRLSGFKVFRLALLVNLFLTAFFDFYTNQFEALYGFFFNLLLLIILNFMAKREQSQPT